jgi:hypothetical protein
MEYGRRKKGEIMLL